jgi:hypothetical protein
MACPPVKRLIVEVSAAVKVLDRNSQICFHKAMIAAVVIKINHARACAWSLA